MLLARRRAEIRGAVTSRGHARGLGFILISSSDNSIDNGWWRGLMFIVAARSVRGIDFRSAVGQFQPFGPVVELAGLIGGPLVCTPGKRHVEWLPAIIAMAGSDRVRRYLLPRPFNDDFACCRNSSADRHHAAMRIRIAMRTDQILCSTIALMGYMGYTLVQPPCCVVNYTQLSVP